MNRAMPSFHGGSREITLTVTSILNQIMLINWSKKNSASALEFFKFNKLEKLFYYFLAKQNQENDRTKPCLVVF